MGFGDMLGKAKEMAGEHSEAVEGAIDKAAEVAKEKLPEQAGGAVDKAAEMAKDQI